MRLPRQSGLTLLCLSILCAVWNILLSTNDLSIAAVDYFSFVSNTNHTVNDIPQRRPNEYYNYYRFPSVDERVRFYLSEEWYNAHTSKIAITQSNGSYYTIRTTTNESFTVDTTPNVDCIFVPRVESLTECAHNHSKYSMRRCYCPELLQDVLPIYSNSSSSSSSGIPLLVQVGDALRSKTLQRQWVWPPRIPYLKKFRRIGDPTDSAIIFKLEALRHYSHLSLPLPDDTPWELKRNVSIFRGAISGKFNLSIENEYDRCMALPRCRLVLLHHNSKIVDANLTNFKQAQVSNRIRNITIQTLQKSSRRQMLQYKCLIVLEGNDVATALKWALLSNSVVLMPPPTFSSWLMEEYLQPYVHYVPLLANLSNVEQQTQWVIQHDAKARAIAQGATRWMSDLLFRPQSSSDNAEINRRIFAQYQSLFTTVK